MSKAQLDALQGTVSELLDLKAAFLTQFEESAVSLLAPANQTIARRSLEDGATRRTAAPVAMAIWRHAFPARVSLLHDEFSAWAHEVVEDAVQSAADEVTEIIAAERAQNAQRENA